MTTASVILRELRAVSSPEKATVLQRFFKTGPGEYGEGDRFLGVMVPQIRAIARAHRQTADASAIRSLLDSPWHEARECGLLLLVEQFRSSPKDNRAEHHRAYLAALREGRVNNWDLVDCSAPALVGEYLLDASDTLQYGTRLLDKLAKSSSLWENRVAVVSTLTFIRRGRLDAAFQQCAAALGHPHDLMHKAVGWMLRECGKRDPDALRAFLSEHLSALPRTSLRYAIERFTPAERKQWLQRRAITPHECAIW